jgi:hypothetical protein
VPLAVFWGNVHGGYIYLFIMLVPFIILHFLTSPFKNVFVSIGIRGVKHSIAAGVTAFLAMVVFNPFHLTNLTHTFVISVSKHAEHWRTVYEWHPAFEWDNPIGDEIPFLIMYIIWWVVFLVWIISQVVSSRLVRERMPKRKSAIVTGEYQGPKADLVLMAVAFLTIYMAIRSRRFIPIAAVTACPFVAMLIEQAIHTIAATVSFRRGKGFIVPSMNKWLQASFLTVGTAVILFLGIFWGLKFKRIYLDPWPNDARLNSIFMRMTASDVKPFYACSFIRDNKLKGNMFNYWTEGGFIAWGQVPDVNTGRTPLQLFMDGRAQAAYEPNAYRVWANIMAGGPVAYDAAERRRPLRVDDYIKIGQWIADVLKSRNVWVALMPLEQFNSTFVKGLEYNPNWPVVYMDTNQKLFVDVTTPRGKELFEGIFSGKTIYPTQFSEDLIKAHNMMLFGKGTAEQKLGFDYAVKSFKACPSQVALQKVLLAASVPELMQTVNEFCTNYVDDFAKNKDLYAREDGYFQRIWVAYIACNYLQEVAKRQKDIKLAAFYTAEKQKYSNEQAKLSQGKRW